MLVLIVSFFFLFYIAMILHRRILNRKGGAWQEKEGGDFSQWVGCNFYIKHKLKCEIFNDKKSLKTKIFSSVITKFLCHNWEILTKNLVTFKR